jgi:hypothetical protein
MNISRRFSVKCYDPLAKTPLHAKDALFPNDEVLDVTVSNKRSENEARMEEEE